MAAVDYSISDFAFQFGRSFFDSRNADFSIEYGSLISHHFHRIAILGVFNYDYHGCQSVPPLGRLYAQGATS